MNKENLISSFFCFFFKYIQLTFKYTRKKAFKKFSYTCKVAQNVVITYSDYSKQKHKYMISNYWKINVKKRRMRKFLIKLHTLKKNRKKKIGIFLKYFKIRFHYTNEIFI